METFEENNLSKVNLLEPPSTGDPSADEEDVKATIKPRFSPLPRRRSSASEDEGELEPPTTVARKVSFADAFGFDLVSVKEFDTWEVPIVAQTLTFEVESGPVEEFVLTPSFTLPSDEDFMEKVRVKKVLLESVDSLPGITTVKGVIRVLNVSYEKQIYVRMSLDEWRSFYDLVAEYVPDSCNGDTDQFCFKLSLAPPCQKDGAKVEFCICYETPGGTFWDNNDGHNYILTCYKKQVEDVEKPSEDLADKSKKSCLKLASSKDEDLDIFEAEIPRPTEKYIPRIICSHDDDTTEDNNDEEEEDKNGKKNNDTEIDLELFLNERLMKTRITSSENENNSWVCEQPRVQDEEQRQEPTEYLKDNNDILKQQLHKDNTSDSDSMVSRVSPTPMEAVQSLAERDFAYTSISDHHHLEATSEEEHLSEIEKRELLNLDNYASNKQKIILVEALQYYADHPPGNEAKDLSVSRQDKYPLDDTCDMTSDLPSFSETEPLQLTEILDNNANPSSSQQMAHFPPTAQISCFSTDDTDRRGNEQNEFPEYKHWKMLHSDEYDTAQVSESTGDFPLVAKDIQNREEQSTLSFTSSDDNPSRYSLETAFESEVADNRVSLKTPANVDKTEFRSNSSDIYHTSTSQMKHLHDEQIASSPENQITTLSFQTEDLEIPCNVNFSGAGLTEKDNVDHQKQIYDEQITIEKQYYNSSQQIHCNPQDEKAYLVCSDNKNIDLSESEEAHDFECPLLIKEEQADDEGMTEECYQRIPHTTCSITSSAGEEADTSDLTKDESVSVPYHVSERDKVVIALITEEKTQSEIYTPSEGSYIEICQHSNDDATEESENESELVMFQEEIEEEVVFRSEGNKEKNTKAFQPSIRDEVEEMPRANISKISVLSEANIIQRDDNHVYEDQYKSHYTNVSSVLETAGVEDVKYTDQDYSSIKSSAANDTNDVMETITQSTETGYVKEGIDSIDDNIEEMSLGPSILISEPDDEMEAEETGELLSKPEDIQQYHYNIADDDTDPSMETDSANNLTEPLDVSHVSSKVFCFVMFVVFAGLMYHYDFLVCFALYLFSLYWLYWEGDRREESIKKE
ncbi:protein phosphatase 1 regulatory subunit 3A [Discoglossus pictus]